MRFALEERALKLQLLHESSSTPSLLVMHDPFVCYFDIEVITD